MFKGSQGYMGVLGPLWGFPVDSGGLNFGIFQVF